MSFNAFIANLAPISWLCMLVVTAALYWTQRRRLGSRSRSAAGSTTSTPARR